MTLYTLVAWVTHEDGTRTREVINPEWRGPFHEMDRKAAELSERYAYIGRRYKAVNVKEVVS